VPAEFPCPAGALVRDGASAAARRVRFLVLDVDGVCTDGKLYFFENGQVCKAFFAQDGLGVKTALKAGIGVGVITGRDDNAVRVRMSQLGVTEYHPGHDSKLPVLDDICARLGLDRTEMAYLGDDWIDLAPMRAVGFPMAVANARPEVMAEALYVTAARGGEGAVREAVEVLLTSRLVSPSSLWTGGQGTIRP
jgi:3-deoxy-D-manno-octulosonate 8-phosphate phosphatase (KDO 8-P phosphatase)